MPHGDDSSKYEGAAEASRHTLPASADTALPDKQLRVLDARAHVEELVIHDIAIACSVYQDILGPSGPARAAGE